MQSNVPVSDAEERNAIARGEVSVILLQNWAQQVNEQRAQLAVATEQVIALDARCTRIYNDAVQIHGLFNESEAELHYHRQLNTQLSLLIVQMLNENPELGAYTERYHALIEGTEYNPIDLTTDEEIDEEL